MHFHIQEEGKCDICYCNNYRQYASVFSDLWKLSRDFEMTVKPLIESRVVELGELANKTLQSGQRWSLDRLVLHVVNIISHFGFTCVYCMLRIKSLQF
jgi:hypothetical protein